MTFADMVSTIQQIQSRLASLSAPPAPASADGGAAFADALSGASASGMPGTSSTAPADGRLLDAHGVTGDAVVQAAMKYRGVPYVLGGESSAGMDCSGLVQRTFADLGIAVPRLVHEQQTIGQPVASLKDAKPGDLIVLNGGDHIAIYAGNNTVIHAPYEGRTVSVQKDWFTDKDITAIRRIVPADAATSDAGASTDVAALSAMFGGSAGSGGLSGLLSSLGGSGNPGTAQQLLAARAALAGVAG